MIGVVIVTHSQLGEALIQAAHFILEDPLPQVESVSIDLKENVDLLRQKIKTAIKKVDQKKGVLILTDMFGGTPSNLSYSFLEEGRIEVLSGVNLPIVIRVLGARKNMDLPQLAAEAESYGRKSISLASGILRGNKREA